MLNLNCVFHVVGARERLFQIRARYKSEDNNNNNVAMLKIIHNTVYIRITYILFFYCCGDASVTIVCVIELDPLRLYNIGTV